MPSPSLYPRARLCPAFLQTTLLALVFSVAGTILAADAVPEEERQRLERVAEVVAARRLIREHESGQKPATAAELSAARAVVNRAAPPPSVDPEGLQRRQDAIAAEVARRRRQREQNQTQGATTLGAPPATAAPAPPADPAEAEQRRLDAVAAEVARRRALRDQAKTGVTSTSTSATQPAPDAEARPDTTSQKEREARMMVADLLAIGRAQRAHYAAGTPGPGNPNRITVKLPDGTMAIYASILTDLSKRRVTVADPVKNRRLNLIADAVSPEEMIGKIEAHLRQNGIVLVEGPDGRTLDAAPPAAAKP